MKVLKTRVCHEHCSRVLEQVLDVGRWKECSEMNTLSNNLSNTLFQHEHLFKLESEHVFTRSARSAERLTRP